MNKPRRAIGADTLMAALALRHSSDLFVPECKNGPTQTGSHRRFDAWVLVSTWSPVTTIGYEVKVSRSDWRRDEKIEDYLGLCHLFYVVAPKGVVPLDEVPGDCVLIEAVGDGTRLVTRRKASRREIPLPAMLMAYILMARVAVKHKGYDEERRHWRRRTLREWVESRDDRLRLSYAVSEKIQVVFHDQERRLGELQAENQRLQRIEARIRELGFDPDRRVSEWDIGDRLNALQAIVPPHLLREVESLSERLTATARALRELSQPPHRTGFPLEAA